jgi:hypothetical protein
MNNFYTAIISFSGTLADTVEVGKTGQGAQSELQKFIGFSAALGDVSSSISGTMQQIFDLKKLLRELIEEKNRFLDAMRLQKGQIETGEVASLVEALEARARYGRRLRARTAIFDDLYRLMLN